MWFDCLSFVTCTDLTPDRGLKGHTEITVTEKEAALITTVTNDIMQEIMVVAMTTIGRVMTLLMEEETTSLILVLMTGTQTI